MCASFVLFDSGNVVVTREDIVRLTTENQRERRGALFKHVMRFIPGQFFRYKYIKRISQACIPLSLINIPNTNLILLLERLNVVEFYGKVRILLSLAEI